VFTIILPVLLWRSLRDPTRTTDMKIKNFALRLAGHRGIPACWPCRCCLARFLDRAAQLHRLYALVCLGLVLLTGVAG
jgi:hypothetical protein